MTDATVKSVEMLEAEPSPLLRDGEVESRRIHAPEAAGSIPAPATKLMVCRFCAGDLDEIKSMGAIGECACCGVPEHLSGPVSPAELQAMRERLERLASIGAGMEEAGLRPAAAPRQIGLVAGIVKTPGIDDALDAIESEADVVASNRELLEGAEQSRAELERWRMLYQETLTQCNRQLLPRGICLGACAPNPNGLGAVFVGVDREQRDYTVTLTLPAKERADFESASKETFVRWAIKTICDAVVEQQQTYLRRMGRT